MKKIVYTLLFIGFSIGVQAQSLTLKKGVILDDIKVNDSISESFVLYLPTNFETTKKWPIIFVCDTGGKAKQATQMLLPAAEKNGYILAASNTINDSLKIEDNVLATSRMINKVLTILPIGNQQIYTVGIADSGKFASLLPVIINNIQGTLSINSPIANTDILNVKKTFHFIGLVDVSNYNLFEMQANQQLLNNLRYPNQLFVYDQLTKPSVYDYINMALETFTISAMAKNSIPKDATFIQQKYQENISLIKNLVNQNKSIQAYDLASEAMKIYRSVVNIDELKDLEKNIRKSKIYKNSRKNESALTFNESLKREDYDYAMFEDIASYNFNNLGWWKYQIEALTQNSNQNALKNQMNNRLKGFVNYLVDKNTIELQAEKVIDEEGLVLLGMLKTITDPKDFEAYKRVISLSAKNEDYSTSLFYLEELLKMGFTDKKSLYEIEHTALLRIAPEFNEIVQQYLKEARYEVETIEE
ncbi:MAG: alpha/beta hydrolase [Cellulophaga sp.]|nr:alpha/beta hydrolase [Cellulophaga sp.]MDP5231793.1 alpha/beta hydrolase [Cellulophaga sp.]